MSEQEQFCRSIRVYRALVRLYPAKFREEFGEEMEAAFARLLEEQPDRGRGFFVLTRPWRIVLIELVPTLLREHVSAASEAGETGLRSPRLRKVVRFALASLLPAAGYVTLLGWTLRGREVFLLTMFFLLTGSGMMLARGRGWACSVGAVIGAMLAVALFVVVTGLTEVTNPNIILLTPLLAATAGTLALILATYVRLVMEGVSLRAA
jgi:hypothetical protein